MVFRINDVQPQRPQVIWLQALPAIVPGLEEVPKKEGHRAAGKGRVLPEAFPGQPSALPLESRGLP